ncbi:16S rRNA (cytidine(1402)-2'-O)-methyltransferase [Neobacillus cucumis]|uniref:Ribosomal RNA small subunit methyltransferase I n=1 Tax=Neobacillus cucumis TaxID=1740721 RepID=A0A2N5HD75_9BACI|nr:16S rRNA (cytidine(1402)-2'-O)-methyltransferase [Neobacillus cucumis]PLS03460.1 16S rRNA (cytidine(1402)-2'-O)-methyltransferase [Neobacillus cucumis]
MWQQKSFENEAGKGILYLVPTPIGNLEDMSFRAIRILKEADWIAAEDTRNTKKLCNYFEIDTPIVSYHEHNKETSGEKLIEKVKQGLKVALVSDAGMPAISDPGYELVQAAIHEHVAVVPLPGANAALTALIASGISCQPFYFYGFLNRNKKEKRAELEVLRRQNASLIFYESPHRLKETLAVMFEVLGDRKIVICRELTKKYEEFIRGTLEEINHWAHSNEIRGEFCLIVEGTETLDDEEELSWWQDLSVEEHVNHYITVKNISSKEAIKQTAKDRGLNKREVYQVYHIDEQ